MLNQPAVTPVPANAAIRLGTTDCANGNTEDSSPLFQVHMLWQLPQYLFIALADIWFAIAVLEFGYKEVNKNLTAVCLKYELVSKILLV